MGTCSIGTVTEKAAFCNVTGKQHYDVASGKAIYVAIESGCSDATPPGSCCARPENGDPGVWLYRVELRIYVEGIKDCDTDEIIPALNKKVYCVDMEDPCEYWCVRDGYCFRVDATADPFTVAIRNQDGLFCGNDIYFGASPDCAALPIRIDNALAQGDCGGNNVGYGGFIRLS